MNAHRKIVLGYGWLLTILLCLVPVPAGCDLPAASTKTLFWGRGSDARSLDLAQSGDQESIKAGIQILENLVALSPDAGPDSVMIIPQLAVSWQVSQDGLTWTFKLRKGVRFHDGQPLNAGAVYDSIARVIDQTHPLHRFGHWRDSRLAKEQLQSVEMISDDTVALVTRKPYAPLLYNLAMGLFPVLSPKAMTAHKDRIGDHPVGTGPFRFVQWTKGSHIILERNPGYWGGEVPLERVVLKTISEPAARLRALVAGDIDMADDLDADALRLARKDPALAVIEQPKVNIEYLALNVSKRRLSDVRVRRALNHAIDRQTLVDVLFQGLATAAKSPCSPASGSYNRSIIPYEYNPEKARQLLEQAEFDHSRELQLWVTSASAGPISASLELAGLIQAYLGAVGVTVGVVEMDRETFRERTANGEHDMCLLRWDSGSIDPDDVFSELLSADRVQAPRHTNVALWRNSEFTSACDAAQVTFDPKERTDLYMKAQEIFHRQAPWVPLVHRVTFRAYRNVLRGLPVHLNGLDTLATVWKAG